MADRLGSFVHCEWLVLSVVGRSFEEAGKFVFL